MKHTFRKQRFSSLSNGSLLLVLGATLLFGACADDDLANEQPGKHTGTTVAFNVSDAQMEALAQAGAKGITRGLSPQPLSSADLAPRKLEATGSNPHDFCLIESTVEGINPVKPAEGTRAEIIKTATLGNFSSIGYRAANSTAAANPNTALLWFHGEKTNPDGTLQSRYDWDWPVNVYGRFYAVYPEATPTNKITLSPSNYAQVPYVDFEVKSNVVDQVDLMTACSGEVHYIHGNDPTSNLKFTHALAAVKFSIGSNLSPVTITKIELTNVKYKGRYRLSNQADGSGATWTSDNATTTMTLDNINMNAAEMPNTMLAGALDPDPNHHNRTGRENYTFLMIPQTMPAKTAANAIKAVIYYQDGATTKTITIPLTGEWKANTTMEYKLSQKNSSWGYHFTLTGNESDKTFSYDANYTGATNTQFQVTSYRTSGSTQQPVPWKISKYEEWDYTLNGGTGGWVDRGTTKPDWLGDITDHGNGGTPAEVGNTAVKATNIIDKLAAYNQVLKDAPIKGSTGNYWNLANPSTGAQSSITESANCYLISAPGYYCFPLVYGNGIKNNAVNISSFKSSVPSSVNVLDRFKDHRDMGITNPIISQQLGGSPDDAKIIWMDQPNLVRTPSFRIVHNVSTPLGSMDYLEFEVKKEDIRDGNAVIAVTRGGEIVWSWHLWFAYANSLDKIPLKNHDGTAYKIARSHLGYAHLRDEKSAYDKPRKARVTIAQQVGNGGHKESSPIIIIQNPGSKQADGNTIYQHGRKDALPGTDILFDGDGRSTIAIQNVNSHSTIGYVIQHPGTMYTSDTDFHLYNTAYCNLWAANQAAPSTWDGSPIVKTIYDPCPAGFRLSDPKVFSGFSKTGESTASLSELNVEGTFNKGWNFKTNIGTSTIFLPTTVRRDFSTGALGSGGGSFWDGISYDDFGSTWAFSNHRISLNVISASLFGFAIHPATDD